jgi:hypothetical protein
MHCFKLWTNVEDPILASLCHGLLYRKLYKTIDLTHEPADQGALKLAKAVQLLNDANAETSYELFYDEPADTPYQTEEGDEILVCTRQNQLVPFAQISPLSQSLNRQLTFRRIHVSQEWAERVRQVIA